MLLIVSQLQIAFKVLIGGKMNLETIYNHAPIWVQNLMCSFKGWLIYRRRYASGFFRALNLLKDRQIDSERRLRDFLKLARNVPAYAQVFAAGKGNVLSDFPIINKSYVKEHFNDFINMKYKGPVLSVHTSGTTGTGLEVPQSIGFEHLQWATWWRYREELGIKFGTWYGWFGCGEMIVPITQKDPPYWRVEYAGRRVMFGTYHLNVTNVDLYVSEIIRRNLTWLHGNASRLCYFSRLIRERELEPITCVRFVTTASENLSAADEKDIQLAFPNAIVRQHYGMTEGVANFSQTLDGSWRIDDDFAHVELIPVVPSNPNRCRIIGTNFSNPVFPLIRYDIGDIAIVDWEGCQPSIRCIEGRTNESITLCNGMLVNSMFNYDVFGDQANVIEAQVRVLNGQEIELLVVKGLKYSQEDEVSILRLARKYLKDEIGLSIRYTDFIPRSKSGKFQSVIRVDN